MSYTEATPEGLINSYLAADGNLEAFPSYKPPTDEFVDAIQNPQLIEVGGATYAAYTFPNANEVAETPPPLLALKSFNNGTVRYATARTLNALAHNTNRAVISIDRVGADLSYDPKLRELFGMSFDSLAGTYADVLEKIGIGEVDMAGICMGGVLVAHIAVKLGRQARSLITFNSIGFERDSIPKLRRRMYNLGSDAQASKVADDRAKELAQTQDDQDAGSVGTEVLPHIKSSRHKENLAYGILGWALTHDQPMRRMPDRLAPDTKWHDFVGDADLMADIRLHRIILAERNRRYPGSSDCTLLHGVGHNWPLHRAPLTAKLIEIALRKSDNEADTQQRDATSGRDD